MRRWSAPSPISNCTARRQKRSWPASSRCIRARRSPRPSACSPPPATAARLRLFGRQAGGDPRHLRENPGRHRADPAAGRPAVRRRADRAADHHPRRRPLDRGDAADLHPRAGPTCCRSTISACARAIACCTDWKPSRNRAPWPNSVCPGRRTARWRRGTCIARSRKRAARDPPAGPDPHRPGNPAVRCFQTII